MSDRTAKLDKADCWRFGAKVWQNLAWNNDPNECDLSNIVDGT
jgi:hypothetical protein